MEFGLLYSLDRRKHEALLAQNLGDYEESFEAALDREGIIRFVMLRWISREYDRRMRK
jgi:hypothetical protein